MGRAHRHAGEIANERRADGRGPQKRDSKRAFNRPTIDRVGFQMNNQPASLADQHLFEIVLCFTGDQGKHFIASI